MRLADVFDVLKILGHQRADGIRAGQGPHGLAHGAQAGGQHGQHLLALLLGDGNALTGGQGVAGGAQGRIQAVQEERGVGGVQKLQHRLLQHVPENGLAGAEGVDGVNVHPREIDPVAHVHGFDVEVEACLGGRVLLGAAWEVAGHEIFAQVADEIVAQDLVRGRLQGGVGPGGGVDFGAGVCGVERNGGGGVQGLGRLGRADLPALRGHFLGHGFGEKAFAVLQEPVAADGQAQDGKDDEDAFHDFSVVFMHVNMACGWPVDSRTDRQ